jgi:methionine-rich copper-binding protein CopC
MEMMAAYRYVRRAPAMGIAALAALLLLPAIALAHAELTQTMPADGAELETPPAEVVLVFDSEIRADGSGFVITGPGGAEAGAGSLDLQVAARNELRGAVTASEPGEYVVAWTAVALDGHADDGTFRFTVLDPDPTDADAGEPPDTAVPATAAPGAAATALIGLVVVTLAIALLVRRVLAARPVRR